MSCQIKHVPSFKEQGAASFTRVKAVVAALAVIVGAGIAYGTIRTSWPQLRLRGHLASIFQQQLDVWSSLTRSRANRTGAAMLGRVNADEGDPPPECFFDHQVVDDACPRFLTINVYPGAGLSDRMFRYALGLVLAMDLNAVLVVPREHWGQGGQHAAYEWVPEMLSVSLQEDNLERVKKMYNLTEADLAGNKSYEDTVRRHGTTESGPVECNVLFTDVLGACGAGESCWSQYPPWMFQRTRGILLCQFFHTRADQTPALIFEDGDFHVAVHVRAGDRGLHAGDRVYWENIWNNIILVTGSFRRVGVYVFTEGHEGHMPHGYEFLTDVFRDDGGRMNTTFVLNMGEKQTLYHFANADLLVCTGSGFCSLGWQISMKPVIMGGYGAAASDVIELDGGGKLYSPPTIQEAEELLLLHHYIFGHTQYP